MQWSRPLCMRVRKLARSVERLIADAMLFQQKGFYNLKNLEHLTDSCQMKLL